MFPFAILLAFISGPVPDRLSFERDPVQLVRLAPQEEQEKLRAEISAQEAKVAELTKKVEKQKAVVERQELAEEANLSEAVNEMRRNTGAAMNRRQRDLEQEKHRLKEDEQSLAAAQ